MNNPKVRRIIGLIALGVAYGAVYNPGYIRYMFYDAMLEALQCTNTQLGLLNSFASIVGILIGLPGGWIADRLSPRKVCSFSVMFNLPLTVIAAMFCKVYWIQLVVWLGYNFTGGFAFWPAVLKAVRLSAPADEQSSAFGMFEAFQGAGALVGNFIAIWVFSTFANQVMGYKAALISMGVYSFIGGLLVLFCYKEEIITDDVEEEAKTGIPAEKRNVLKDTLSLLANPGTYLVGGIIVGCYGLFLAQTYFTSYFTGVLGAAVVFSATMSNIRSYGMKVLGGPTGGFFANKIGSTAKFHIINNIICVGLIIYVWRLSPDTPNVLTIATAFTLILAFFCCMGKGTMWAAMEQAHIPAEITGTAISIISYIGFTGTEAGVPALCGHFLDKYSYDLALAYDKIFMFLIALSAVGVISAILLTFVDKNWQKKHADEVA